MLQTWFPRWREVISDTALDTVVRPREVEAWRVPVIDDGSEDEEHPPYELGDQVVTGEVSTRHRAGGDMLRRTTNAAVREARESSPAPSVPRDITPSANATLDGINTAEDSPDSDSISTAGLCGGSVSRFAVGSA